jgi:NAD(P)-dependent dehydrogenase (short-subunit alcohol dehydrogenase family)
VSEFRDRVALITGAASGIGRRLAARLKQEGARLAAIDTNAAGLESLAQETGAATAVADVTDLTAMRAAARELEAKAGPTDLLIASAGIGRKTAAAPYDAEGFNATVMVNLVGLSNSVAAVVDGMRERRRGHLVALSSLASYRGLPFMSGYCASKAGVNALFDALRVELAAFGVRTTTVCPGWIKTPMTDNLGLKPGEVMAVEAAAEVILDAVRRDRAFVAFPGHLVRQVRLLKYLPRGLSDWLTRRHLERAKKLIGE